MRDRRRAWLQCRSRVGGGGGRGGSRLSSVRDPGRRWPVAAVPGRWGPAAGQGYRAASSGARGQVAVFFCDRVRRGASGAARPSSMFGSPGSTCAGRSRVAAGWGVSRRRESIPVSDALPGVLFGGGNRAVSRLQDGYFMRPELAESLRAAITGAGVVFAALFRCGKSIVRGPRRNRGGFVRGRRPSPRHGKSPGQRAVAVRWSLCGAAAAPLRM